MLAQMPQQAWPGSSATHPVETAAAGVCMSAKDYGVGPTYGRTSRGEWKKERGVPLSEWADL